MIVGCQGNTINWGYSFAKFIHTCTLFWCTVTSIHVHVHVHVKMALKVQYSSLLRRLFIILFFVSGPQEKIQEKFESLFRSLFLQLLPYFILLTSPSNKEQNEEQARSTPMYTVKPVISTLPDQWPRWNGRTSSCPSEHTWWTRTHPSVPPPHPVGEAGNNDTMRKQNKLRTSPYMYIQCTRTMPFFSSKIQAYTVHQLPNTCTCTCNSVH